MPRLALLVPFALLACSSAPPPPAAPPETAAASPAPAAPPAAAPAASAPPSAHVVDVVPTKGEPFVRAKIVFENPGKSGCRVLGYKLLWAGKSKAITLGDLTLPPGETRERWLKVSPDDGDLAALTPSSGQIELKAECGP
jgi:hypothetical protein